MEDAGNQGVGGYEFTDRENRTILGAATWIGLWAWVSILAAALTGLGALLGQDDPISRLVMATAYLVVGLYFRGSARSMRNVAETRGDDVEHLMEALDNLTRAFKVMVVLVAVAVLVGLLFAWVNRPAALV